jgi:hypothetical protein
VLCRIRVQRQQGLRIGIQVFHLLDHELRPGCTTFLTVQRSMERRMPWRSLSEMSGGNSTWILKICL